jgi:hypothetical protein
LKESKLKAVWNSRGVANHKLFAGGRSVEHGTFAIGPTLTTIQAVGGGDVRSERLAMSLR